MTEYIKNNAGTISVSMAVLAFMIAFSCFDRSLHLFGIVLLNAGYIIAIHGLFIEGRDRLSIANILMSFSYLLGTTLAFIC